MNSFTSFDLFDTLVSRRLGPQSSWIMVERVLGIPNFVEQRIQAEWATDGTILESYRYLVDSGFLTPSSATEARDGEEHFELDSLYPINQMLMLVNDGDQIVSDYYNTKTFVQSVLEHVGLKADVELVVSPEGKRSGKIWGSIRRPRVHVGDNLESDVRSARRAGIAASHITMSAPTPAEARISPLLGEFARSVRLQNPFLSSAEALLFDDQAQLNLLLQIEFVAGLSPQKYAVVHRDGIVTSDVVRLVHPGYEHSVLHASRLLFDQCDEAYANYVEQQTRDAVILDSNGTGVSYRQFTELMGLPPQSLLFITSPNREVQPFVWTPNPVVEKFQYSVLGSPYAFHHDGGFARLDCEYGEIPTTVRQSFSRLLNGEVEWFRRWYEVLQDPDVFKYPTSTVAAAEILRKMSASFTARTIEVVDRHSAPSP